jgi:hypothetical protein
MPGGTAYGTIWAQWVHGVSAGETQTVTVNMNSRFITAYASIQDFFVIHPAQYHIGIFDPAVPPTFETGWAKISELHWHDDDGPHTWTGSSPYVVGGLVTKIKFKASNTRALFVINYWE